MTPTYEEMDPEEFVKRTKVERGIRAVMDAAHLTPRPHRLFGKSRVPEGMCYNPHDNKEGAAATRRRRQLAKGFYAGNTD
jgi:hypothetical protein